MSNRFSLEKSGKNLLDIFVKNLRKFLFNRNLRKFYGRQKFWEILGKEFLARKIEIFRGWRRTRILYLLIYIYIIQKVSEANEEFLKLMNSCIGREINV